MKNSHKHTNKQNGSIIFTSWNEKAENGGRIGSVSWNFSSESSILARQDYCDITNGGYDGGSVDRGVTMEASKQATLQIRKERDLNTDDPLMIQTSNGEAFVQIYVKVA